MFEKGARREFRFVSCMEVKELLGRKARDEAQLLELLDEVPSDSIFFHTHGYFLRHKYLVGLYRNDFANWIAIEVGDRVLGEKLGVLDPYEFSNLEAMRSRLMDIVDAHLSKIRVVPGVIYGEPFYFMQSKVVEVPTGVKAKTLEEFRDGLSHIDAGAIYYHVFEAMMRRGRRNGDFSIWLEEELNLPELAERIKRLDPYMYSLETLRKRLLCLCDEFLKKGGA